MMSINLTVMNSLRRKANMWGEVWRMPGLLIEGLKAMTRKGKEITV